MKTKQLFGAVLLAAGIFTGNAQTNTANASVSSGGLQASSTGTGNAFYGYRSGYVNTATGLNNTFIGQESGRANTTGDNNVCVGRMSGIETTTGSDNVYIGNSAGGSNVLSNQNVIIGAFAGIGDSTGNKNTIIGYSSGLESIGANNVFLGASTGSESLGSNNVFIGNGVGTAEGASNRLAIDNQQNSTPLIWGDFANNLLKFNGKVGIGLYTTPFPLSAGGIDVDEYGLIVNGGILAREVRVATSWADYVFEDSYRLAPLSEVECYIAANGHLPNVPSAKQVEAEGIEVGQMAKIQQEKIEELTLYLIGQNKQLEKQQQEIDELKALVQALAEKK